uniref:Uncharacterized protein n=1 Tax=Anguilla anguilla TaxID=7936 RepID=A0A0E9QM09_ANGAN
MTNRHFLELLYGAVEPFPHQKPEINLVKVQYSLHDLKALTTSNMEQTG